MLAESDFGIELPMKELIFEYLTERRALDRIVLEYPGNKTLGFLMCSGKDQTIGLFGVAHDA